MKITPIEIRQHTFQRVLRGYDTEDVTAFLTSLSNEWERIMNENKMLKMQLEIAEKDLNKLREVELTMFRMLKTAEDTSAQMTDQAKNAAEIYIEDARQKGEDLVNEARKKANMLVVDAENQAKYVRDEITSEFKGHERDFKAMEKYRDNLIVQLKTLSNNTVDSIERFEKKFSQNIIKEKFDGLKMQVNDAAKSSDDSQKARIEAEKLTEDILSDNADEPVVATHENIDTDIAAGNSLELEITKQVTDEEDPEEKLEEKVSPQVEEKKKATEEGSFFDQI